MKNGNVPGFDSKLVEWQKFLRKTCREIDLQTAPVLRGIETFYGIVLAGYGAERSKQKIRDKSLNDRSEERSLQRAAARKGTR